MMVRAVVSGAAALGVVLSLVGCTAEPKDSRYPDISLAQAKSNVQLLRNDAASRIPDDLIAIVLVSSDLSAACEPQSVDPDGLIRAWHSGARVSLVEGADLDTVIDDLVASFVGQGWEEEAGATTAATTLSKTTIFTRIEIATTAADDETGKTAEVTLALTSPCVVTGGESSKEVRQLEAMAF